MILRFLLNMSIFVMLISFLVGIVEFIFLATLFAMFFAIISYTSSIQYCTYKNLNRNVKKHSYTKCIHISTDCESCMSQSACVMKNSYIESCAQSSDSINYRSNSASYGSLTSEK